jgi:RimJ/RimL family protein N-acetyltransferase
MEHNVLATILVAALDGDFRETAPLFAYAEDSAGTVTAAALRTPPFSIVATELAPDAAHELMALWLQRDPAPPGANAEPGTAQALASAWRTQTGGTTSCVREMARFALSQVVDPPRPPAGRLRLAELGERDLLTEWWDAFANEAKLAADRARAAATVDARLAAQRLFVWDDDGPVSFLALSPTVAGVARIGPVYTPPANRRRGYAGMAVADMSRHALAHGATACMLFTDLANPTSNKIYKEVGYRRVGDWEEQEFHSAPAGGPYRE